MKKNLFKIATLIMLIVALAGCGNKNNAADNSASKEAEKKEEAPMTEVAKDEEKPDEKVNEDAEDIGEGSFYIKNESGTTENGEPITLSYDESLGYIPVGIVTSGIDISRQTAVYVDDTLMTLNYFEAPETEIMLMPDQLEEGPHKLVLKQFKDDDREGEPTLVKSAPFIYETK